MRRTLVLVLLLTIGTSFLDYNSQHTLHCQNVKALTPTEIWTGLQLHALDQYWFMIVGPIVMLLLILMLLTFFIKDTLTQPGDILLAMSILEIMLVANLITQAGYEFEHDPVYQTVPPGFGAYCTATGSLFIFTIIAINVYNIVFCLMLAITVRKTLKANFFSKYHYHILAVLISVAASSAAYFNDTIGKEINGLCGFQFSTTTPFLYLAVSFVFVTLALTSVLLFFKAIPKNSFFRKQLIYKYYYVYCMLVAVAQFFISLGYVIGVANCRSSDPNPSINIFISFANCLLLLHPMFLCFIRYQHPKVKQFIKQKFSRKKDEEVDEIDPLGDDIGSEEAETDYNWLGSLIESIRASQVLSFLTGILISHVQHFPYKVKALRSTDYRHHYIFKISEQTANNYLEKCRSKRESYKVTKELGGLLPLDYEVTSYCPRVFAYFLQQFETSIKLDVSLNIQSNRDIIRKMADVSGGKSGEFFFFSHDSKIIFKTVSAGQANNYLKKLHSFAEHYKEHDKSLIVKLIGLYKFRRLDIDSEDVYIILQKNLAFCGKVHIERVFDLKGSKFNRETLAEQKVTDLSSVTLKDVDFIKTEGKIHVSHFIIQNLKKVLRKDIEFLRSMCVMDYSLLVMKVNWKLIAFSEGRDISEILPQTNNYLERVASETQDGIYYNFGIIDYLQEYNVAKKTENFIKKMVTRKFKDSIVTVEEPQVYSNRLILFIQTIFP